MNLADRAPEAVDVAAETLLFLEALQEAAVVEWQRAPIPRRWEAERGSSAAAEVPNPTLDLVADPRRMAVRVAVWEAYRAVHDARRRLAGAVDAWHGRAALPSLDDPT